MKKMLFVAIAVFAFAMMITAAFAVDEPDWSDINDIVPPAGQPGPGNVLIDENLTGYPTPTDAGPYARGYVGHSYDTYCNTDRHFEFYNWVSVAQWMRVKAQNIDRHIMIRKPGTYTFTSKPMEVRIASNGDVLVTFQELWGSGGWDAEWYEYTFYPGGVPPTQWDKTYPQLANALSPQEPVDKKYMVLITPASEVDETPPQGWVDVPAGDEEIKFLNNLALHELETPVVGFDMQFREIVVPCNTTGDYVLKGRVIFQCANQMWYIDPQTGAFDRTRDATLVPPELYPGL